MATPKTKVKKEKIQEEGVKAEVLKEAPVKNIKKGKEEAKSSMLVMFTLEGRSNWKSSIFSDKADFDKYLAGPNQNKHPKVLLRRWFVLDYTTGNIIEEK